MYIERLQVEAEGFLSGLDVSFSSGLNVIIGARGTGKTSIVELIRFGLGAGAFTEDAGLHGRQQAVAILDGGAVTLTLRSGDQRFEITRSASGHLSNPSGATDLACTVLAQNEIEAVGAQAAGRLHLIDRFRSDREQTETEKTALRRSLVSLTTEIAGLLVEGRSLSNEVKDLGSIAQRLDDARKFQNELLSSGKTSIAQQEALAKLQQAAHRLASQKEVLARDASQVSTLSAQVSRAAQDAFNVLQTWPESAGPDLLVSSAARVDTITELLQKASTELQHLKHEIESAQVVAGEAQAAVDLQGREVRQALDASKTGVGLATKKVSELEQQHGQLVALSSQLAERRVRFSALMAERDALYDNLEELRDRIYDERAGIADSLSRELGPAVRVRVVRSENVDEYKSAIVAALRGSGVHYNSLAPQIAREIAPNELVSWIERGNSDALASVLDIPIDRAGAIVNALQLNGGTELLGAVIDDGVGLDLLDGKDYKPSGHLSIGQRCTVVLPILLRKHGDPLVLDQPEDHLDNAFIASTLVAALRNRAVDNQFIFTSHNANVPVLGEADRVIVMESDGVKGSARRQGPLDDTDIVRAVSDIMEGGPEAFRARAEFYAQRTSPNVD